MSNHLGSLIPHILSHGQPSAVFLLVCTLLPLVVEVAAIAQHPRPWDRPWWLMYGSEMWGTRTFQQIFFTRVWWQCIQSSSYFFNLIGTANGHHLSLHIVHRKNYISLDYFGGSKLRWSAFSFHLPKLIINLVPHAHLNHNTVHKSHVYNQTHKN